MVRFVPLQVEELRQQKRAALDRLLALQEDFEYNLELLDGRDAELELYERRLESLQAELQRCHHENHSLSTQLQLVVTRALAPICCAIRVGPVHYLSTNKPKLFTTSECLPLPCQGISCAVHTCQAQLIPSKTHYCRPGASKVKLPALKPVPAAVQDMRRSGGRLTGIVNSRQQS